MRWGNLLNEVMPVEEHGGMLFKRDDKFAPRGYGSINGAKLRQCIYLVDKWVREDGCTGVSSGSVSQSPQHIFIAAICNHYNIHCYVVTGVADPMKHKYLRMAHEEGATISRSKVGYAAACGAIAKKSAEKWEGFKYLETNITLDSKKNYWGDIEAFHRVGSLQSVNIPDHVTTLIVPCGSCNSITSILYGLVQHPRPNLERIVLLGIGNIGSKNIEYVYERLFKLCKVVDIDIRGLFNFKGEQDYQYEIEHHDLNGTGFCKYTDEFRERIDTIEFHPRYEGKCIRYMKQNLQHYMNMNTLFWIVGSDIKW
jgi:1-aminocyclopropane-1-carboxylate deaminase/D-cysteine desulfhydrase-like pyridoxal-dependent ACC family enzyme